MSAARREKAIDRTDLVAVKIVASGEVEHLPYRRAVGLISLGRAEWAKTPKKKSSVSTPGGSAVQEGAEAGNKPPSGPDTDGGA